MPPRCELHSPCWHRCDRQRGWGPHPGRILHGHRRGANTRPWGLSLPCAVPLAVHVNQDTACTRPPGCAALSGAHAGGLDAGRPHHLLGPLEDCGALCGCVRHLACPPARLPARSAAGARALARNRLQGSGYALSGGACAPCGSPVLDRCGPAFVAGSWPPLPLCCSMCPPGVAGSWPQPAAAVPQQAPDLQRMPPALCPACSTARKNIHFVNGQAGRTALVEVRHTGPPPPGARLP